MTTRRLLALALLAVVPFAGPAPSSLGEVAPDPPAREGGVKGEQAKETSLLTIAAIIVEPPSPGPDTLCKLRVRIDNRGSQTASRFGFEVGIGGRTLPIYQDQLILRTVAAGTEAEIELHRFWSSETARPFPQDGKLIVEVTLTEASWVGVEEKDGVETRTPVGKVEGLPVSRVVTLSDRSG